MTPPDADHAPSAAAALAAVPLPLALVAPDGVITFTNDAWPQGATLVGQSYDTVLSEQRDLPDGVASALRDTVAAALAQRSGESALEFALSGDPPARWLRVRCAPVEGGGAVVLIEDVSAERRRELALALRADHDPLTGLANRHRFFAEGARMLSLAQRHGWGMALLFIDLDAFKAINDSAGHSFGDAVLQQVARRLSAQTRAGDLLARFGGDEFVALLNDIDGVDAEALAHRYRRALRDPPIVPGAAFEVGASVGMAWYPGAASNLDTLVRLADAAMYRAKAEGKGVVSVLRATAQDEPGGDGQGTTYARGEGA